MPSGKPLVIFDIGNGSVGAASITFPMGEIPQVDYVKRLLLPIKERVQTKTLVANTLSSLREISASLLKEKRHSHDAAIFFASPWHILHTKVISIDKKETFTVTRSLIEEIVEREVKEIQKQNKDQVLIDKGVIHIKINGYSTNSPYGKTANRLEVSLYTCFVLNEFLNQVAITIEKNFSVRHLSYHSFPITAFSVIQRIFQDDHSFIFIDITSEITDIVVVVGGSIIDTGSFPVGKNILIRKVADYFKITPDLALSFVKLFGEGKAASDLATTIGNLSGAVREEWQAYFYEIVKEICGALPIPRKVFVTADDDVSEIFLSYIKEPISIKTFLGSNALKDLCHFAVHVPSDSFLAIESVYLS